MKEDDLGGVLLPPFERARAETESAALHAAAGDARQALKLLETACTRPDQPERLAQRLLRRAEIEAGLGELPAARRLLEQGLRQLEAAEAAEAAEAVALSIHTERAWLAHRDGDYTGARASLLTLLPDVPAKNGRARGRILNVLGVIGYSRGEYEDARTYYRQALTAYETAGEQPLRATVLNNLGILAQKQGDFGAAIDFLGQAMTIKFSRGDRAGLARLYNNLGTLAGEMGELKRARDYLLESIRIKERVGDGGLAVA